MAAASGDEGDSEAWMDIVDTRDLLWRGFGAAPLLVRRLVVIYDKFLHLNEALDDWRHPEVHLWDLKRQDVNYFACLFH